MSTVASAGAASCARGAALFTPVAERPAAPMMPSEAATGMKPTARWVVVSRSQRGPTSRASTVLAGMRGRCMRVMHVERESDLVERAHSAPRMRSWLMRACPKPRGAM